MSFILDALKKSETDRQERSSAEFSKVPTSGDPARTPRWLLVLGVLLAINLVALLGLLFRSSDEPGSSLPPTVAEAPNSPPAEQAPEVVTTAAQAEQDADSFANRVAQATRDNSAATESSVTIPSVSGPPPAEPQSAVREQPVRTTLVVPTIFEVIADGSIVLPDLHLDIHVYSEVPEDRFVFINMSKQREKSQLSEGPLVEEITPEGVILAYRGKSFLLPRD